MKQTTFLLVVLFAFSCSNNGNDEIPNQAPEGFTLKAVTNGAIGVDVTPTFSWNAAIDPDGDTLSYELFMDGNNNPTTSIATNISGTTFILEDRLPLTKQLFWKVIATDHLGNTTSSNIFSFTTRNLRIPLAPVTTNAAFSGRSNHTSVVFNDKMWILGGDDGVSYLNDVWNSSDGITWTEIGMPFSNRSGHTSVVFDNKIWVIGGYNGFSALNDVWSSSDGIIWEQITSQAAFPKRWDHTSVVFDNKIWIINGRDGPFNDESSYFNDIWYSSDGITWIQATSSVPFQARSNHTSMVFNDKIWVLGGYDGSSVLNDVWHSSDGITWTKITDFSKRVNHTSIVFDDKIWVIDGFDGFGGRVDNDVIYSSGGIIWNQVMPATELPVKGNHTSVIFDDKIWIIGGNNNNDVRFMY